VDELLKKGRAKKFFKWFGISFGIILIIGLIYICVMWGKQIITLNSLEQVNGNDKNYPFYTMTYKSNYGFDDYLQSGSKNLLEYKKFIIEKTMNGVGSGFNAKTPNCSSFTAITYNGDKLFARNLDLNTAMPLLLMTNPNSGYKSMSMADLEVLGIDIRKLPLPISVNSIRALGAPYVPLDGMNEHGLAVSALTANGSYSFDESNKVSLNDVSLIRMVLDKATNVEEAVKMIENYNMDFLLPSGPNHFMIADATGASVVIEYIKGELKTVYSDKPYQIVTNFILYNNPNGGDGLDRYQRIEAKLKDTDGILTEKEAMKILLENAIPGREQWSVVYNLTQKKAYICVGKNYENIYEFDLDQNLL
jgi:hypothetical protein